MQLRFRANSAVATAPRRAPQPRSPQIVGWPCSMASSKRHGLRRGNWLLRHRVRPLRPLRVSPRGRGCRLSHPQHRIAWLGPGRDQLGRWEWRETRVRSPDAGESPLLQPLRRRRSTASGLAGLRPRHQSGAKGGREGGRGREPTRTRSPPPRPTRSTARRCRRPPPLPRSPTPSRPAARGVPGTGPHGRAQRRGGSQSAPAPGGTTRGRRWPANRRVD